MSPPAWLHAVAWISIALAILSAPWIALFALFGSPERLPKSSPIFWLMMQIAMLAGFATSYPVNWWLLRRGIKEAM